MTEARFPAEARSGMQSAKDGAPEAFQLEEVPADQVDESKLPPRIPVRQLDFRVLPLLLVTYMIMFYDKGLLGHAVLFGFLSDLDLEKITITPEGPQADTSRYANVNTAFYAAFIAGALPVVYLGHKFGTKRVVTACVLGWSLVTICTPACKSYSGILVNRFFLGLAESGVGPLLNTYMSKFWDRRQQSARSSIWYSAVGIVSCISAFIDYGLGQINGSLRHWEPMFIFIGGVGILWSVVLFVAMPEAASSLQVDAADSTDQNHSGLTRIDWNQVVECLTSFTTWSSVILAITSGIVGVGMVNFLTLAVQGFGFSIVATLALTVPSGALYAICMILAGYISGRFKHCLYLLVAGANCFSLAGTLVCWLGPRNMRGVLYFGSLLLSTTSVQIYTAYYAVAINTKGKTKRNLASALVFASSGIGNLAGSYVFSSTPAPRFVGGWTGSSICIAVSLVTSTVSWLWLRYQNRKRDATAEANEWPADADSLLELTDKSDPTFRYIY